MIKRICILFIVFFSVHSQTFKDDSIAIAKITTYNNTPFSADWYFRRDTVIDRIVTFMNPPQTPPPEIDTILPCIKDVTELRNLWMTYANLRTLPEEIGELTKLEYMDFDYCHVLHGLPSGIGNLKNLKVLKDLPINIFPTEIFGCQNLERFSIGLRDTIPSDIDTLKKLKYLRIKFHEANDTLNEIPDEIGNLVNLDTLIITGGSNKVNYLPESVGNLENLEYLKLELYFDSIPSTICSLVNLGYLNLNWNVLTHLPEDFGNLINLKELNLDGNKLTTLPLSITKLTPEKLDLGHNCINPSLLPEEICEWADKYDSDWKLTQDFTGINQNNQLKLNWDDFSIIKNHNSIEIFFNSQSGYVPAISLIKPDGSYVKRIDAINKNGFQKVFFNTSDLSSGFYLLNITTGNQMRIKKLYICE